jgi:hypothetical protein
MQVRSDERSLGELFGDLTQQLGTLVRQEVQLARTEMTAKAGRVGRDVASLAAGAAILYAGFLGLMIAAILLLATLGLPAWVSALIVGAVVAIIGVVLVMRGRDALQKEELVPERTIRTLKEDAEAVKGQTR